MNVRTRSGLGPLIGLLVTYRNYIYLGGLAVIVVLFVLTRVGVAVPETARTVIVVVALCVMVVTYAGERLVGDDGLDSGESRETYPLRMRAAVALAVFGAALGVYLGLKVNPFTGGVFIVGSYFFAYLGYRGVANGGG